MLFPEYNLLDIPGFNNIVNGSLMDPNIEKYYSIQEYSTKSNEKYTIVRYNKDFLFSENISTYGLMRSIILSGTKIVGFSPQKAFSPEIFMNKYSSKTENIIAEEFIEGTMINVFYDYNYGINGCWQISTRNTVGAEVSFYKWSKKTFNDMFIEACTETNFNISTLNPLFSYSFVLQHPENRIVVPIKKPQLYLVGVYKIVQEPNIIKVIEQNMSDVKQGGLWNLTSIKFPEEYTFTTYSELIEEFGSSNTAYNIMGVVVKNKETGERTKFRNPIYEEVRHLRGNQPKLQYQYLCLRHSGNLPKFLKYFPETKEDMSMFRDQIHMYTRTLHQNYISCYVRKEKPLKEFPDQYRTHMYKLHEKFLNDLREKKLFVTNTVVINYVNSLPPSLLMYCLNYNMRKRMVDTIKISSEQ
jgi:hypothetical protein